MRRLFGRLAGASPSAPGYVLLSIASVVNILIQGTGFFSAYNFSSIMSTATPLILVSIGQMVVILAGGVDLSVGGTMALVNVTSIALANQVGLSLPVSWLLGLTVGTLVGLMNGVVVAYIRLPPFLATFATMSIVAGLALYVLPTPGGTVPRPVYARYGGFTLGLPTPVWIVVAAVLIWTLVNRYPVGKQLRAVGGDERSTYASGVHTARVKLFAYTLGGFFTGMAGLCLTALTASGDPLIGIPFTLKSLAAVILGGTLFDSGWGGIGGTIAGSLFFVLVSNIVFFAFNNLSSLLAGFSASTYYQDLVSNLIIIFGLVSTVFFKRRRPGGGTAGPLRGRGDIGDRTATVGPERSEGEKRSDGGGE